MSDRRQRPDRRARTARRRPRERRRVSSESFAVIEVAGSDLRAVFLQRGGDDAADQVHAATLPWREEAESLNSPTGLNELSRAMKVLADQHNLSASNVQIVLGGEFCVTKAIRGTSEEVRNELQQLEQRSRLYLMLGPGEKVTVSNSRALDARHHYAVAAVCNEKTLETIHRAAVGAGIQVESIEPALVSSSRAIGRLRDAPSEPCLLVHLDRSTVELGICHGGRLLLDYRPGGHADPKQLVDVVRTHLSRLRRHVGRQLREAPPKLNRVYLCGEETAVRAAYPAFAVGKQFQVEIVDPKKLQATWQLADGVDTSASVPSLGALLSTYLPKEERDAPNFMEHILASTREPLRPTLVRSAIPLAAVLLTAISMLFVNYGKQNRVDVLQHQVDQLAATQARHRELRLKLSSAEAKLEQLTLLSEKMRWKSVGDAVARVGHCMPSDVWLNRLRIDDMRRVQLSGASFLDAGVFDFVQWLELAPGFEEVALKGTRAGQSAAGPTIDFDVELSLEDLNGSVTEVAKNE